MRCEVEFDAMFFFGLCPAGRVSYFFFFFPSIASVSRFFPPSIHLSLSLSFLPSLALTKTSNKDEGHYFLFSSARLDLGKRRSATDPRITAVDELGQFPFVELRHELARARCKAEAVAEASGLDDAAIEEIVSIGREGPKARLAAVRGRRAASGAPRVLELEAPGAASAFFVFGFEVLKKKSVKKKRNEMKKNINQKISHPAFSLQNVKAFAVSPAFVLPEQALEHSAGLLT